MGVFGKPNFEGVAMKFRINSVLIALLLVTLVGGAALAKTKRTPITFTSEIKLNGTVVKPGTYEVVLDEQTNELSIEKSGKVVAKASVRVEKRDRKALSTETLTQMIGAETEFVGMTFAGSQQNLLVTQSGTQAGGNK
jgi:hypothetical protein